MGKNTHSQINLCCGEYSIRIQADKNTDKSLTAKMC